MELAGIIINQVRGKALMARFMDLKWLNGYMVAGDRFPIA
jgi:hypothetical protein